jgi:DNA repair exonuclease SbcCD ATPase subunit
VDAHQETASVLVQEDSPASYSPELRTLVEFDKSLTSIAADVVDLQEALTRLREESAEVERSLDERQAELAESEHVRTRLLAECARSQEDRAEARASLAEAAGQLEGARTQVASLEHTLSQREAELAESELVRARLADDYARAREGWAETQASLADAEKQLDAREADVAALDSELRSLRLRLAAPQTPRAATLQEASEPEPAFHLRLVSQLAGYELSESPGPPPRAGERVEVDGRRFCVARVGGSPLPDDERPCAFLLLEAEQGAPPVERAPESVRG